MLKSTHYCPGACTEPVGSAYTTDNLL